MDDLHPRRQALVGQQDDRHLVALGVVEGVDRRPEAVLHRDRRDDDPRGLAVAAVEGVLQVGLLGLGRQAGGRPAALGVDHDAGDLRGAGVAEHLGHQREARAGGGRHRLHAGVRRAEHRRERGDLVLALDRDAAHLGQLGRQPLEDVRGRRDRVAGEVLHPGRDRAEGDRLVARHQDPVLLDLDRVDDRERADQVGALVVAGAQRGDVRVGDALLVGVAAQHQLLDRGGVERDHARHGPHGDHVLGAQRAADLLGELLHPDRAGARQVVGGDLDGGVVEEDHALGAERVPVEVPGLLVEADEQVHVLAVAVDLLVAHPHLVHAGAALDLGGVGAERLGPVPAAGRGLGQDVPGGDDPLAGLPGKPDHHALSCQGPSLSRSPAGEAAGATTARLPAPAPHPRLPTPTVTTGRGRLPPGSGDGMLPIPREGGQDCGLWGPRRRPGSPRTRA